MIPQTWLESRHTRQTDSVKDTIRTEPIVEEFMLRTESTQKLGREHN